MSERAITVLNKDLEQIWVSDIIYSLLWVEHYDKAGECSVELRDTEETALYIQPGYYILIPQSDKLMLIENIESVDDSETTGQRIIVTGRTAESILDFREVQTPANLRYNAHLRFEELLDDNFLTPANPARTFPNLIFEFVDLTGNQAYKFYENGTVYDIVIDYLPLAGLGFRVCLDDNSPRQLKIHLYKGLDRSGEQTINPPVIFSKSYDNVLNSKYVLVSAGYSNVVRILTDDTDPGLADNTYWDGAEPTGYNRSEYLVRMTSPRNLEGASGMTIAVAQSMIDDEGARLLNDLRIHGMFDGTFQITKPFEYGWGKDFYLGDVVQCALNGKTVPGQIVERTFSYGEAGYQNTVALDFEYI